VTSTRSGEAGEKTGQDLCSLFIPSAVNPTTGFLLVVPREKIKFLDMTPEQAMKMIVSAGALVPATTGLKAKVSSLKSESQNLRPES